VNAGCTANIDAPAVEIAMPAYNCAPWLDDFMHSLLDQDFAAWRLLARDDRSSDDTNHRLLGWQSRLGRRMAVLPDSGVRNLGVIGNYNAVFAATSARWVMSADPDDVWLPGKISRTLAAMRQAEDSLAADTPVAICTDAQVVDGDRRPLAPSFWRWSHMNPSLMRKPRRVAMESVALGSTMMVNRALLDVALPIESQAAYQDWWLALVAAAFGHVGTLDATTILYRRHGCNATSDPYGHTLFGVLRRTLASPGAPRRRLEKVLAPAAVQAAAFVTRYGARLNGRDAAALRSLAKLPTLGPIQRRLAVLRHGLWFASASKNVALFVLV
jgi:glycosyltransferase involved in cell wall biosynthesis